jgi:riboflavin kinase/FMN adenylyltransferase
MREYLDINDFHPPDSGLAVALGRFDGVHVGHRALIARTVDRAHSFGLVPACFSFRDDTYALAEHHSLLTTNDEKKQLLALAGIEILIHPAFEHPFIDTSAPDFVNVFLADRWKAKYVIAGYDFHFGRDRTGDTRILSHLGASRGIRVDILDPVRMDGDIVKATAIRSMLRDGDIPRANMMLGRPYSVTQRQVPGQHLGTEIGFPTLNFDWPDRKVMVPYGVHAVRVTYGESGTDRADGVAGFGFRPTVQKNRATPILEVYILEPEKLSAALSTPEVSDRIFKIEFYAYIRPEKKFDSLDSLKTQIQSDCESARNMLS